jgi:galactokinase/mevalonate kinase-like predicted kinase
MRFSAPGRAGILGNPSDMYGGTVISCAVPLRARCNLSPSDRLSLQIGTRSLQPANLDLQSDEFDVFRVALKGLGFTPENARLSLQAESDIPPQAGLAGSTALLTAIIACLLKQRDGGWHSLYHLAETVRRVEAEGLQVACGFQDQHMAAFGGLNYMDFRDKENLQASPKEPFATIEPLQEALVTRPTLPVWLAFTGFSRHSGIIHSSLRERWEKGERAVVEGMARIASLARIGKRSLIEEDWHTLAGLMNENYTIIHELGGSGDALHHLVQVARENGALAAKLAGAGGAGGTVLVLTLQPETTLPALREHAQQLIPLAPKAPGLFEY